MTDWMTRFTISDCGVPHIERVHRGDGVACATDTRRLLLVDDPGAGFGPLEVFSRAGSNPSQRNAMVARWRQMEPPADAVQADLFDLWAWLGEVGREKCDDCNGLGRYDVSDDGEMVKAKPGEGWTCSECEGRGWFLRSNGHDSPLMVSILGEPFDPHALAWWLAPELADLGTACRMWAVPGTANPAVTQPVLFVAGERWRLVAMPLLREWHPARLRSYLPGAGAWWRCRRSRVARLAGADWAQERGADGYDLFGPLWWEGVS